MVHQSLIFLLSYISFIVKASYRNLLIHHSLAADQRELLTQVGLQEPEPLLQLGDDLLAVLQGSCFNILKPETRSFLYD